MSKQMIASNVIQCPVTVSGGGLCKTPARAKNGGYCTFHFNKFTEAQKAAILKSICPKLDAMASTKALNMRARLEATLDNGSREQVSEREQVRQATAKVLDECKRLTSLAKLQSDEIAELKKQLQEATMKSENMYEDYNVYQEIRNFEEISGQLMNIYMAESHYELFGLIATNPKAAIPFLGENPEVQYQYLRNRRNKFCHPVVSPDTGYQKNI